jgi:hypothetical protein
MVRCKVEYSPKTSEDADLRKPSWQFILLYTTGVAAALFMGMAGAQQKPAAAKVAPAVKPAAPAVRRPPRGPIEKYDCRIGTEDQHARIAVLAQGGEVQSVAYYGKWKPRTCSVHLQRGDAYSKWNDVGDATTVTTEHGDFLIQVSRSEYQLFFREVDRMHYCGMMGKLNGSMTVTRGPKRQCSVEGIMDRNQIEALNDKETPQVSAASADATDRPGQQSGRNNTTD